ncbi:MAG: cobyrinate a,c-diamide synthase [Desulfobacterales bacterium]|nr:cobyrinate a,c-diamide synthase [Desulfobacterales bacterium]
MKIPRLVISAMRGGAGKTLLSIGIIAAWRKCGKKIAPFKKGPDYIDTGWLALAAASPCHNLDTFMMPQEQVLKSFLFRSSKSDVAVIEGNRGLYDGIDHKGSTSTAELAKLLDSPVIVCLDCTKSTRTLAAAVLGCLRFDPHLKIKGVILNRIAGARHERIIRRSIEQHCGIPVLGAVPKLIRQELPERHMGLIPPAENCRAQDAIAGAREMAEAYLDLKALAAVADQNVLVKPDWKVPDTLCIGRGAEKGATEPDQPPEFRRTAGRRDLKKAAADEPDRELKIGIVQDAAFQFYYPENIEALEAEGATPVFISPLKTGPVPPVDAIYMGGGFPETHARQLADNERFKACLKSLAREGLPVYAECGGLIYLGQSLVMNETSYPMAGVFPIVFGFSDKPEGHGYTVVEVTKKNPYFAVGTELRGHEFHYSRVLKWDGNEADLIFSMKRGSGFINKKDGLRYKNILATYTHIHALGTPLWAPALVRNAREYNRAKRLDRKNDSSCRFRSG